MADDLDFALRRSIRLVKDPRTPMDRIDDLIQEFAVLPHKDYQFVLEEMIARATAALDASHEDDAEA